MERSPSVTEGSVISFHDLSYSVEVKKPGSCCGTLNKQILTDIHGLFKPGMNALMGPTGSGKSSLLDVIAGRKDPRGLSGTLLVDGARQPKNYKCMTGYVVQDDIIMGTLTVRENLIFSARLRLPASLPDRDKTARVDDMISELGLERCADSKIGNEFIRGVSGGERKRTAIGMELIVSPSVLFLDEPTTGLDAATSNSVITLLSSLSKRGRTIIFSIHQPRYSIFRQFDRLMMLAAGKTVYHGPAGEAIDFFSHEGYHIEEHNNPPDFFLDVILGVVQQQDRDAEKDEAGEGQEAESHNDPEVGLKKRTQKTDIGDSLASAFLQTKWHTEMREEVDPIISTYHTRRDENNAVPQVVAQYATSFSKQFSVLAARAIKNVVRNPSSSAMQVIVMAFLAVISGIIYLRLDNDMDSGIQNRVGAFFFIAMNQAFINVSAITVFISERSLFVHENVSGFYRVSAYFIAKVFCDVLPVRIIPLIVYCVITYFMIGFQMEVEKFFIYAFTLFCTTLASFGIAFFASCVTPVFVIANLMCIMTLILMMIFGGLLVNVGSLGDWISWLQWLSIFRYSLKALYINELKDMEFCGSMMLPNGTEIETCTRELGNMYLETQGIAYETTWDLYQNHLALGLFGIFLMVLSYVFLRKMKKSK